MFGDLLLMAGAYILGSLPFGVLVSRAVGGVDVRRVGSGNIGATNVLRAVGRVAAVLTLLGDVGKGALAVGGGRWLGAPAIVLAAIGVAAVLGHLFPVFSGFRGGKGVATGLGVVLAAMPPVGGLFVAVWLAVAAASRYSSLAALAASAALPPLAWLLDGRPAMIGLAVILLLLIVVRHRENIQRLWRGTEGRIGERIPAGPPPSAGRP